MTDPDARPTELPREPGAWIRRGGVTIIAAVARVPDPEEAADLCGHLFRTGASLLRVGAEGPRRLEELADRCARAGLGLVAGASGAERLEEIARWADVVAIGGAAMHDLVLLGHAAATGRPVLLTRGRGATIDELLFAAEHLRACGAVRVALVEAGVRGTDPGRPTLLDLSAVPVLQGCSDLPVVVDPVAGGAGERWQVAALGAAVAAGADGVQIGLASGAEADLARFGRLAARVRAVAAAVGREMAEPRE